LVKNESTVPISNGAERFWLSSKRRKRRENTGAEVCRMKSSVEKEQLWQGNLALD
jgi:hypothetical protein